MIHLNLDKIKFLNLEFIFLICVKNLKGVNVLMGRPS